MLFTHGIGKIKSAADKKNDDFDKKCDVDRASSVLLFPTFWGLSYFFLLLGKIPTFSYFFKFSLKLIDENTIFEQEVWCRQGIKCPTFWVV